MTDITELEAQLHAAQKEAKEKTKALESTLATVSSLYQISSELSLIEDTKTLYKIFLEKLTQLFGAEIGVLYKIESKDFSIISSIGLRRSEQEQLSGSTKGILEKVVLEKKIIRALPADALTEVSALFAAYPIKATILSPIETKSGVTAIIQCSRLYDETFTTEEERVIRILVSKLTSILDTVAVQETLKIRTRELERLNNLMIDRELKMIELKKRIAILEAIPRGD